MSFWVYLQDRTSVNRDGSHDSVFVQRHCAGGTYAVGGTELAELNVTYNYGLHFRDTLDRDLGLRWLHDKQAKDTIARLQEAVAVLGVSADDDYWKPTAGNAGLALSILASWAQQHPEAYWRIS